MKEMLSLKKPEKAHGTKQKRKMDEELPYFITMVFLLANSGLSPYLILKKISKMDLLPIIKQESVKLLKRIDFLTGDPLTTISNTKGRPYSEAFSEFLGGYILSIQSGGDVLSYLKSQMKSAFDIYAETERNSIEKTKAIVESFMTLQVVVLAVFIIVAAMGSNPLDPSTTSQTSSAPPFYIMLLPVIISIGFLKLVQNLTRPKTHELELKKILIYVIPSVLIGIIIVLSGIFSVFRVDEYIIGVALIAGCIWPTLKFKKIYALGLNAESATPRILRDITEARKVGLGPEKCVQKACAGNIFNLFNPIANSISNKLQWGVSLDNIFNSLQNEIKNFQVLISFKILFEIISSGGGNAETLDSLAETSEKVHNIEKTKHEMLKPYVMVAFMLMGITGFSILMVIDSFGDIEKEKVIDVVKRAELEAKVNSSVSVFSIVIIFQSWITGLVLGKIITGNYSGGFQYSLILVIIALIAVTIINLSLFKLTSLF